MLRKGLVFGVVVLFIGISFNNAVGYQVVQSSNKKAIKDAIDQKELLFQTIIDIVNDKEVQSVVLKYHSGLFHKDVQTRVLTLKQLNSMYFVGSIFSKRVDRSKVQSTIQNYMLNNQELLNEIGSVIENNVMLNTEMEQLELLNCDCEANKQLNWGFPVICGILWALMVIPFMFWFVTVLFTLVGLEIMLYTIWTTVGKIAVTLNCFWVLY